MATLTTAEPWAGKWRTGEKPIARGGQGYAFLTDEIGGERRKAVLKKLRHNESVAARMRMAREVVSLSGVRLEGGTVPELFDHNMSALAEVAIPLYLVEEFIEGQDLAGYVKKTGRLSVDDSVRIVTELAKTIKIGHDRDTVHRDLKPDNVIVRNDGVPFIIDYGLSFRPEDSPVSNAGDNLGSKFFALPEMQMVGGDRRNRRTDVSLLCALFYFCLTGHEPRQPRDENGQPPHRRPGYSVREAFASDTRLANIESLLDRGLQPEMDRRFATVDQLIERLANLTGPAVQEPLESVAEKAKRLSIELSKVDPDVQAGILKPVADAIMGSLQRAILHKIPILSESGFAAIPSGAPDQLALPDDMRRLGRQFVVKVTVTGRNLESVFRYGVGVDVDQCCLCRSSLKGWKKVAWFAAGAGWEQTEKVMIAEADEMVSLGLDELAKMISQR